MKRFAAKERMATQLYISKGLLVGSAMLALALGGSWGAQPAGPGVPQAPGPALGVQRDESGAIFQVNIPFALATDELLGQLSQIQTIRQMKIAADGKSGKITAAGFRSLQKLPGLEQLWINCSRGLPQGALSASAQIKSLRALELASAGLAAPELEQLASSGIERMVVNSNPESFTEAHLERLGKLKKLAHLELNNVKLKPGWEKRLEGFPALKTARIKTPDPEAEPMEWTRPSPK